MVRLLSDGRIAATLAFLLAREETGRNPTYRPEESRADLLEHSRRFAHAFDRARSRIRNMDVQVLEEDDSVRQAILEMYAPYVAGAEHNTFDSH